MWFFVHLEYNLSTTYDVIITSCSEDSERLKDVTVENKQDVEVTHIYSDSLAGMMDALSSIMPNVMKVLAISTVVLAIWSRVFRAFGVYTNSRVMSFIESSWEFIIIAAAAAMLSVIVSRIIKKVRLF